MFDSFWVVCTHWFIFVMIPHEIREPRSKRTIFLRFIELKSKNKHIHEHKTITKGFQSCDKNIVLDQKPYFK